MAHLCGWLPLPCGRLGTCHAETSLATDRAGQHVGMVDLLDPAAFGVLRSRNPPLGLAAFGVVGVRV